VTVRSGLLVAVAASLALWLLLGAAVVRADTLVWVSGGNVVAENADGTQRRAVTADATAAAPYASPSVNDAGDVAALHLGEGQPDLDLYAGGTARTRSPLPWVPGAGNGPPYSARLLPDSTARLLVYTYGRDGRPFRGGVVAADAPGAAGLADDTAALTGWSAATPYGGGLLATYDGALTAGGREPETSWLRTREAGSAVVAGEVSREAAGRRLLVRMSRTGAGDRLGVFALGGTIPDAVTVGDGCWLPLDGAPRGAAVAPDGQRVAWVDGGGLHVAAVAVGSGEACVLSGARVVDPAGSEPAFSRFTQAPPDGPTRTDTTPHPPPTTTTTVPDPPRTTTTPTTTTPQPPRATVKATVAARASGRTLRTGLRVTLRTSGAGRATVRLTRGKKTLATRTVVVPTSGRAAATLRVARRAVPKRGTRLALTVSFRAARGGTATASARLIVRS
jgi:hypothetical protein